MELELTPEKINQIVRAARILAPGFSEEQFKELIDSQERLADSGFCQAAWGLACLEQEKGIIPAEALDACETLRKEQEELEVRVAKVNENLQSQQKSNREEEERYRQLLEATERAKKELVEVKAEWERQEQKLVAYRKDAEEEKRRIDQEVEEYRQKANTTKQEITAAAELKARVGSCGFSLELMLGLSQEFAGYQNSREKLAEVLNKHRKLIEYIKALQEWAEGKKKALESELANLESQRNRQQAQIKSLEETRHYLQTVIAQLQADVVNEEELKRFHRRYQGVSGLMECLASWEQVIFLRCNNPVSAFTGVFNRSAAGAHFWTDKPAIRCPHCGLAVVIFDEEPYQTLGWQVGAALKLQLGE